MFLKFGLFSSTGYCVQLSTEPKTDATYCNLVVLVYIFKFSNLPSGIMKSGYICTFLLSPAQKDATEISVASHWREP